jgi:predicted NAD/FAD-binding protein
VESVAIVGGGCAGLVTAYLLRRRFDVTVFEPADHLGGHAHTVDVRGGPDRGLALDVGFMVMNPRTYPLFYALLSELGVSDLGPSEMSFGYWEPATGFQYALNWDGADRAAGDPVSPALRPLLPAILRLQREAMRVLADGGAGDLTLGAFLETRAVPHDVCARYLLPMTGAIWSTDPRRMTEFPARRLFRVLDHLGLLSLEAPPRWQHVGGGSRRYVDALVASLPPGAVQRRAVRRVARTDSGVLVDSGEGEERYARAVLACHADQARALLEDATAAEADALSAWSYQVNRGVLHTDASVMPPQRESWASWNAARTEDGGRVVATYHLNRLQGHTAAREQYFLTLDPARPVAEEHVLARVDFTHPVYGPRCGDAQRVLREASAEGPVHFCGSYLGDGFHEDAVRSAHDVARALGAAA